jgi:hypothetical protein
MTELPWFLVQKTNHKTINNWKDSVNLLKCKGLEFLFRYAWDNSPSPNDVIPTLIADPTILFSFFSIPHTPSTTRNTFLTNMSVMVEEMRENDKTNLSCSHHHSHDWLSPSQPHSLPPQLLLLPCPHTSLEYLPVPQCGLMLYSSLQSSYPGPYTHDIKSPTNPW